MQLGKNDLFLVYLKNIQIPEKPSFLVGCFHGDTPGHLTRATVDAVATLLHRDYPDCELILGLDANCYADAVVDASSKKKTWLRVSQLDKCLNSHKLLSCFGSDGQINQEKVTTCMSRTFLQPQMNKAVLKQDRIKGDTNPKVGWEEDGSTAKKIG